MLQIPLDIVANIQNTPYIWGGDFQKVYIIYQKKIVEKFDKHGKKYKRLDFFKIFVIMATTREIEMYLNVTI